MQVLCVKASLQLAVPPGGRKREWARDRREEESSSKDRAMSVASSLGLRRHERGAGKTRAAVTR